ncbi:response regulator transcription factor [Actinoplanes hulinensis]|uniref:Response regulator transcription factor n=2 Tax=Actinoplanes hulinensis TaxID=1144547 RepID=A0ABS7B622_9ACTN|nr:response regulator transcription factor [Actinoplanes hulinensis]MBW6436425.1 response regulator transcription factor [Actinoplanes hulinensis]
MLRIVVVDDQDLVRGGFMMILDAEPDMTVVGEAADGLDAVRVVAETQPDVVVMDIRMPGPIDGIEATRRICETTGARVLMLTTFDLDEHVHDALRAGANGFLLKTMRRAELVDAVRVVAKGEALLAPTVTRRVIADLVRRPRAATRPPALLDELTNREQETLRLVARGLSNAEIATRLSVSDHTVKTHVSNVLTKLGLRDRVQAVIFSYEAGLVSPGEGPD